MAIRSAFFRLPAGLSPLDSYSGREALLVVLRIHCHQLTTATAVSTLLVQPVTGRRALGHADGPAAENRLGHLPKHHAQQPDDRVERTFEELR